MIYYQIGAVEIVIIFIAIGAYRGILRTLFNLIGLALNAFLSYSIAGPLAKGIYNTFFKQTIITKIQEIIAEKGVSFVADNIYAALPDWLKNAAGIANQISGKNLEQIPNNIKLPDSQTLSLAQSIESALSVVAIMVLTAITTLVLFFFIMIIIKLLIRLILRAFEGPVLRTFDRVFGAVLGAAEGIILVFFICVVFNIKLFS